MFGRPLWSRSKNRPFAVMMPNEFCSGVNATDEVLVGVRPGLMRRMLYFSYGEGSP